MNELTELCPICIEKPAENYTECNHGYCISCLCRIKKCAMCRNPLQRNKLCIEIKQNVILINNTPTNGTTDRFDVSSWGPLGTSSFSRIERDRPQLYTSPRLNFNHPVRELIWQVRH